MTFEEAAVVALLVWAGLIVAASVYQGVTRHREIRARDRAIRARLDRRAAGKR